METLLGSAPAPPDPTAGYRSIDELLLDLSRDPEASRALPELLAIALYSTQKKYDEEVTVRRLEPVLDFIGHVTSLCHYYSPMVHPRELSFLLYLRWTEEVPRAWYEDWPPRRPRIWIDSALKNERWEKAKASLLEGA